MQRIDVYLSSTVLNSCVLCTRTVKNRGFWVSTVVDFAVSVAVGVIAAAVVAGGITLAVAAGATSVAAAPLWAIVVVTAIVGVGIGWGVDALGIPKMGKDWLNGLFKP
jgi:hypothetical protein